MERKMVFFFSYAESDAKFVVKLATDLRKRRISPWVSLLNTKHRQGLDSAIKTLKKADCIIVILSPKSASSKHVLDEISYAVSHEKLIIPIMLRNCEVPLRLMRSRYVDFTGDYSNGLINLLEALLHTFKIEDEYSIERDYKFLEPKMLELENSHSVESATFPSKVFLSASVPRTVDPGYAFVAKFAAYTEKYHSEVNSVFEREAPDAAYLFGLHQCLWKRGTKVLVRLNAEGCTVSNNTQEFKWNGMWEILRFDVKIRRRYKAAKIILKFDVFIEGLLIATLRPEVPVLKGSLQNDNDPFTTIEKSAPGTAFASYSEKDKWDVMNRIRSVQIATGIEVFVDCLSIRPGEEWKASIEREIKKREIFWLFWSRNAMRSAWVEWEWRTALQVKPVHFIQPHPLESSAQAPPPKELEALQFGAAYEAYLRTFKPSAYKTIKERTKNIFSKLFKRKG